MKINKKSPRTVLAYRTFVKLSSDFFDTLAGELGYDPGILDTELANFLVISARVEFDEPMDFELALLGDDSDTIKNKFIKYLDTDNYHLVERAIMECNRAELALDEALAPEPPDKDKKK